MVKLPARYSAHPNFFDPFLGNCQRWHKIFTNLLANAIILLRGFITVVALSPYLWYSSSQRCKANNMKMLVYRCPCPTCPTPCAPRCTMLLRATGRIRNRVQILSQFGAALLHLARLRRRANRVGNWELCRVSRVSPRCRCKCRFRFRWSSRWRVGGCGVWEINNLYANFAFAMREKPMNMKMFSFSLPAYNPSAIRHLNPHTHTHTHTFSISKQWGNWKQNMMMFDWQIFHAAVVESKPESESEGTKLFPSSSAHRPPFKYLAWPAGRN